MLLLVALFISAAQAFEYAEPDGSTGVRQNFDTPDCTGSVASTVPLFYDFSNTCAALTTFASRYSCSLTNYSRQVFIINGTMEPCFGSRLIYQETSPVATCINIGSTSFVEWCDPSLVSTETPKPFQAADESAPALPVGSCDSVSGCGTDRCTARYYNTSDCSSAPLATFDPINLVPYSAPRVYGNGSAHNPEMNTCYYSEITSYAVSGVKTNVRTSLDGIGFVVTESTGGCGSSADTQKTFTFPVRNCFRLNSGLREWATITCPGYTPTYVASPSNPPSDAPTAPSSSTPSSPSVPSSAPQGSTPSGDNSPSAASLTAPLFFTVAIALITQLL